MFWIVSGPLFGTLLAVLSCLSFSQTTKTNKRLQDIHFSISLWIKALAGFGMFSFILGIEYFFMVEKSLPPIFHYNQRQWIMCLAIGSIAAVSNLFFTVSSQNDGSAFIGLVNLTNVPYGFLVDVLVFHINFKTI